MPASTPGGLPYPLPTEPVAEGAQAIRNLAEAADRSFRIEDKILSAIATPITFSAIPATFAHLRLLLTGRSDAAGAAHQLVMRFNGDATANYDAVETTMVTGAVACGQSLGATSTAIGEVPGASAIANAFSCIAIDIFNYRNAFPKLYQAQCFDKRGLAAGDLILRYCGGAWRSTAAITSISVLPANGYFVVGTRATLYGLIGP